MATRKMTSNLPDVIDGDEAGKPPLTFPYVEQSGENDFEPDDMAVMSLLSELGNDSETTVRVYRQGKAGYRDLTFLFEVPPNEFSPTVLQNEPYNGGEFRIHARSKNGLVANKLIRVAPLPGARTVQAAPDLSNVLAPINQQINALAGVVQQMAAMMNAGNQKAPSRMEMLQEMQMMRDIIGGGGNSAPQQNPIMMLKEIIGVSKELGGLNGGGNGEPPDTLSVLMRAMEMFGKPIVEMAAANKMQQAQTLQQAPQLQMNQPPIQSAPINQAPQPALNPQEQEAEKMFKYYFNMLIGEAANDTDPTGYAHMIVSKMPQALIDELIMPPDYLERLAKIDERVKLYPGWFGELREITLELLTANNPPVNNGITSAPISIQSHVHSPTSNTVIAGNPGRNTGDQSDTAINDPLRTGIQNPS